jgi:hypothetical protein
MRQSLLSEFYSHQVAIRLSHSDFPLDKAAIVVPKKVVIHFRFHHHPSHWAVIAFRFGRHCCGLKKCRHYRADDRAFALESLRPDRASLSGN